MCVMKNILSSSRCNIKVKVCSFSLKRLACALCAVDTDCLPPSVVMKSSGRKRSFKTNRIVDYDDSTSTSSSSSEKKPRHALPREAKSSAVEQIKGHRPLGQEEALPEAGPSRAHSSSSALPTRCTIYRRKKREEKDRAVLAQHTHGGQKAGDPCNECGHARRAETGHAYFKGDYYCTVTDMHQAGRVKWLKERGADESRLPRTTAWRVKRGKSSGDSCLCQLGGQLKK